MKITDLKPFNTFETYTCVLFQVLPTSKMFERKKYNEVVRIDTGEMYLTKDFEKTELFNINKTKIK